MYSQLNLSFRKQGCIFSCPVAHTSVLKSLNDALKPGLVPKDKEASCQHRKLLHTYIYICVSKRCLLYSLSRPTGGVEVRLHSFLTSARDGGEWSTWPSAGLPHPGENPGSHWEGGCVARNELEKNMSLAAFGIWTPTCPTCNLISILWYLISDFLLL